MRRKAWSFAALAALLYQSLSPAVFSQEPELPPPTLRTTTRLVVLDAIVTDSKSQPVPGLKPSDFTVLEDGKPQKISFFSYQSPQPAPPPPPAPLAPGVFTNLPEYHKPAGPLVILLMDGLNTPPNQGLEVRKQIMKYLASLKTPESGTAVLALGNDLTVLQDFTTSADLLRAAAEKYKPGRTAADVESPKIDLPVTTGPSGNTGPVSVPGSASTLDTAASVASETRPTNSMAELAGFQANFERIVENQEQDVRVRGTLSALRTISRAVAGYSGRKALLWFSASFPFSLNLNAADDVSYYKSYRDDLKQAAAMLSDANVAVYPVDARSLFTGSMMDVSAPTGQNAPSTDLRTDTFKKFSGEATMDNLARDTGGLVFRNTNDLSGALQAAVTDSQSYYTIGYYPQRKNWDGKFHNLKVEVAGKDVKVRSRSGYFALDPADWKKGSGDDDKHMITADLHTLAATGVTFFSHLVTPEKPGGDTIVEILVNTDSISFGNAVAAAEQQSQEPGPNRSGGMGGQSSDLAGGASEPVRHVDVQFEVGAYTPDGKLAHIEGRTAQADLHQASYEQLMKAGKFAMKIEMPLKPGEYLVRVAVRDNRTGRTGTLDMPYKLSE